MQSETVHRWGPRALVAAAVLFAMLFSLLHADTSFEPDPYPYRAQMAALADGHVSLTKAQYTALAKQLTSDPNTRDVPGEGGIMQWSVRHDGRFISEKNPGFAFLALPFHVTGTIRLIDPLLAALAAAAMLLALARVTGRWLAALAVAIMLAQPLALMMSTRPYMPSYAGAMLIAIGASLATWALIATEHTTRRRTVALCGAVVALAAATSIRYTDIVAMALIGLIVIIVRARRSPDDGEQQLSWGQIALAAACALPFLIGIGIYNNVQYGGPLATGYDLPQAESKLGGGMGMGTGRLGMPGGSPPAGFRPPAGMPAPPRGGMPGQPPGGMPGGAPGGMPGGARGAVPGMPRGGRGARGFGFGNQTDRVSFSWGAISKNVRGMPRQLVYAMPGYLFALIGVLLVIIAAVRRSPRLTRAGGIAAVSFGSTWLATWAVYSAYDWTTSTPGGGPGGAGMWLHTTRFYLPAIAAIGAFSVVLLMRVPRAARAWVSVAVAVVVCAAGGLYAHDQLTSGSAQRPGMPDGGAPMRQ